MERIKDKIQKLKETGNQARREIQYQTVAYVVAAFSVVVGLAWNDAIKSFIEYLFPITQNSVQAKFVYAILVTVVIVIVSSNLIRYLGKKD